MTRYALPQPYEEIDHTADAGVVVRGASREETLARLILAFSHLSTAGGALEASSRRQICVAPDDDAAMAVDLLRELLFLFDSAQLLPASVEVLKFDAESGAEIEVELGVFDPVQHAEGLALKAITLHEAHFAQEASEWVAQVVFDV